MDETDPKALFQQRIPKSYLDLQCEVLETAKRLNEAKSPPLLYEQDFYDRFCGIIKDIDELEEAVNFLSLQGMYLSRCLEFMCGLFTTNRIMKFIVTNQVSDPHRGIPLVVPP